MCVLMWFVVMILPLLLNTTLCDVFNICSVNMCVHNVFDVCYVIDRVVGVVVVAVGVVVVDVSLRTTGINGIDVRVVDVIYVGVLYVVDVVDDVVLPDAVPDW